MKKLLTILLCIPFATFAQVDGAGKVEAAIRQIVWAETGPLSRKIDSINMSQEYDTVLVVSVSKAGNIDTLTAPGIYKLTIEGNASAVRLIYVSRSASGVLSTRTANPLAWSGAGTWSTAVVNNRVVVSTTATGIIYKREKY